jgi:anti-sigma regulatory factor (Ser/Thr protein kinase)
MDSEAHTPDGIRLGSAAMLVLGREAGSVAQARDWVETFLGRVPGAAVICDDAVLIVSELVTNSLRHGLGEVVIRASTEDATLAMSVTDSGEELPVLREVLPDRVGGVGLQIVERLSTAWGVAPFPGGKTVWVTLALPSPG